MIALGAYAYAAALQRARTTRAIEDLRAIEQRILNTNPATISGLAVTGLDTTNDFKFNLADGGWLLFHFSGTEPVVRVYCETTHEDKVRVLLEEGMRLAGLATD